MADEVGIRTPDQRLRVFVSSTLDELAAERAAARQAIERLRLAPVMFESGARPHRARDVYRAYLEQSDLFVGIYWQQYGWIGPGMTVSGLEDELDLAGGKPRLLYVKRPAPGIEPGLRRMLDGLRADGGVSYTTFTGASELREMLVADLAAVLTERFQDRGGRAEQAARPAPVPAPATELVGRDAEVSRLAGLMDREGRRMVVLTGPGGVGKTRLALAVLAAGRGQHQDGGAFADLSSVTDPAAVPEAIASALGMVAQGRERPLDTMRRRLAGRDMLLVLDNFEQVLDAAPVVSDLVTAAPRLFVLVTSRVVLHVRGEYAWPVGPLALPDTAAAADLAAASRAPAVRLLIDRIRNVRPGFELTEQNAAAVAELCRRLDGLPLALELAGSWLRLLSPEQLLAQLDQRLASHGALVDLPERQQSLADTIEWSYDRLPAVGRVALGRLSVFAAPFTAQAAEVVSGMTEPDPLAGLSALADYSMVSQATRPDGEPGFVLLDTIRRFAAARIDAPDEAMARLEAYLLGVLADAGRHRGASHEARRKLDSEQLNLQAVLTWMARARRPPAAMLRGIGDCLVWLLVRGYLRSASEMRQQLEALPRDSLVTKHEQMAWFRLRVPMLLIDGQLEACGRLVDEILPESRQAESPQQVGDLLLWRALSRDYVPGSPAQAELAEAADILRATGDLLDAGYAMAHYGFYLCLDGEVDRARALHEETLSAAIAAGDDNLRTEAHYDLALDAITAGDAQTAGAHLAVAVHQYTEIDHRDGLARCLGALAALAQLRAEPVLAAWLTGAVREARESTGLMAWPTVTVFETRTTERIRTALPADDLSRELAAGRQHSLEDALDRALHELADQAAAW